MEYIKLIASILSILWTTGALYQALWKDDLQYATYCLGWAILMGQ